MRLNSFFGLVVYWTTSAAAAAIGRESTTDAATSASALATAEHGATAIVSSASYALKATVTDSEDNSGDATGSLTAKSDAVTSAGANIVATAASVVVSETASAATSTTNASSSSSSSCSGNSASDRTTWCDYDISTDYYNVAPDTGVVREYWFNLEQATVSPDGYSRIALTVNGSIPGPTIFADWGDTVRVHVTNELAESHNGTSIHFHGIRQNFTNPNDGVVSITQCPTAVGSSITYEWKATQYGSSWYHSHFALQAFEGVFGGIVINGPSTANYDEDSGILFLNDWSHQTADELYASAQSGGPPTLDNGLINGTNVYGNDNSSNQTGSRFEMSVESGTSYRLRLVNAAIDTHFKFMIDNHTMTVMASDLVPIEPYETTILDIGMGQRYDIIVTADQADVASDFWMRAIPQEACSENDSVKNIKGIFHYGSSNSTPSTSAYSYTDECVDEDLSSLVPYLSLDADTSYWTKNETASVSYNSNNLFRWYMNSVTFQVTWENPTLLQLYNNQSSWNTSEGVIELPEADEWAYVIIDTDNAIPHPIHLHGHDFFILAQGTGDFSEEDLNLSNPPRRDVAMLPESGYLVLAFKTDNPGAWLMHCHIGWHTEEGFAIQFIERQSEIADLIDYTAFEDNCEAWTEFASEEDIVEDDDGI